MYRSWKRGWANPACAQLNEGKKPLEDWEVEALKAGYDAWKADPTAVYKAEEVRAHLEEARRRG